MRNAPVPSPANPFLRQALLGLVFLALVAIGSLPAARAAGPIGWMPLWLLGAPLAALAALAAADLRAGTGAARGLEAPAGPARSRVRAPQARRSTTRRRRGGLPAAA